MKPTIAVLPLLMLAACQVAADGLPAETPLAELPYSPSLDLGSIDRSADPCGDFYQYACGTWEKNNPIPADQSSWSVYC